MALLGLSAWIRRQGWLRALHRHLPQRWRDGASSLLGAGASAHARFPRSPRWDVTPDVRAPLAEHVDPALAGRGVNILGYIRGQFGVAESARLYARALIDCGVDVALYDIDLGLAHGWDDRSLEPWIGEETPHPVSIIFVNPDYLQPALAHIGAERLRGRYLIACWFWELETVPAEWVQAMEQVDEIMVASHFVEQAFLRATRKPVTRVPMPLGPQPDSGLERADFGLEAGCFTFLATFDFNSWVARKNPFAVLAAFKEAFADGRQDVRLLIKSSNGFRHPQPFGELLREAGSDPRIIIRDDVIDRAHVNALQRCCDAYVSLHRAEGFGLGLAECMAMGKPVIATGWSGNLDFMDEDCAALVRYALVPVKAGEYPHPQGQRWAAPDTGHAAQWMRQLADDPAGARELGERGRQRVLAALSPNAVARQLMERISRIEAAMASSREPRSLPGTRP
ncbi:glycosyltransferase family 4 protein [Stenotrophomonas sp. S41]|uniref:glycosyltransferase family 4 protein n=1 Tax=Stenotrophomonas sp. S41 TaxID=2767464 RepID=UPI001F44AB2E|nr:glycosyltransferase family 4 protein [Stenotrophomonas sp. S41]